MTSDPHETRVRKPGNTLGVGAPVALLLIGGAIVGGLLGQPSIGLLVGAGLSVILIAVAWRLGQRK